MAWKLFKITRIASFATLPTLVKSALMFITDENKLVVHNGSGWERIASIAAGQTAAATANTIMQRDAAGRAAVANPSAAGDIANKTYVDTENANHANLTNPHSATDAATASRLVLRDAAGRAKFVDPSVAADAATKNYVDTHANLTNPHSAVSAATANRLMLRDASGRAQVASPAAASDIATKEYVDNGSPYAAGNNLHAVMPSWDTGFNNTTYAVGTASFTAKRPGTIRVKFSISRYTTAGTVYGQIYKNGVAAGTERSVASATPSEFSEDISVAAGDIIEIYRKTSSASYGAQVGNARITTSDPPVLGLVNTYYASVNDANAPMPAMDIGQTCNVSVRSSSGSATARCITLPTGGSYAVHSLTHYGLSLSVQTPSVCAGGTIITSASTGSGSPCYGSLVLTRVA